MMKLFAGLGLISFFKFSKAVRSILWNGNDEVFSLHAWHSTIISHSNFAQVSVGCYKYFLRPAKDLKKLGKWAIVTGMLLHPISYVCC